MCGVYLDPLLGLGIDPAAKKLTAWEDERMGSVPVDDGKLQVAFERRSGDRLPHGPLCAPGAAGN